MGDISHFKSMIYIIRKHCGVGLLCNKNLTMLNRKLTIAILAFLNIVLTGVVGIRFGLNSINNWLLILSFFFFSMAAYRVLGMVEGYKS
jgi:hypothetical protein